MGLLAVSFLRLGGLLPGILVFLLHVHGLLYVAADPLPIARQGFGIVLEGWQILLGDASGRRGEYLEYGCHPLQAVFHILAHSIGCGICGRKLSMGAYSNAKRGWRGFGGGRRLAG